jgi:hypothetical protein
METIFFLRKKVDFGGNILEVTEKISIFAA